jgi:hypothetical protein
MRAKVLAPTYLANDAGGFYVDPDVAGQEFIEYQGPLHLMQSTLEPLTEYDRALVAEAKRRHKAGEPLQPVELELAQAEEREISRLTAENASLREQLEQPRGAPNNYTSLGLEELIAKAVAAALAARPFDASAPPEKAPEAPPEKPEDTKKAGAKS